MARVAVGAALALAGVAGQAGTARPAAAATFAVTDLGDAGDGTCDATCTLRDALLATEADAGADTITFAVDGSVELASDLPVVTSPLTVRGNGADRTTIDGNGSVRSLFEVRGAGAVTVEQLRAVDGRADPFGGAISLRSANTTVTLDGVVLEGGDAGFGGGVYVSAGTLVVHDSVITGNAAHRVSAGLYLNGGTATLVNTVLSDNHGPAGAAFNNAATLELVNSTVVGNTASNPAYSAGVDNNGGVLTVHNSIVAGNTGGGGNCYDSYDATIRHSLVDSGCAIEDGVDGNLRGDPLLDASGAPTAASPVVDAGSDALVPAGVTTDLAGGPRIRRGSVDMGAYESAYPFVATISAPDGEGAEAGPDPLTFRVTRDEPGPALDVAYTVGGTAAAADVMPLAGSVQIPDGATSADITVEPVDDAVDEPDETVELALAAGAGYVAGSPATATGTIADDDAAGFAVLPAAGLETSEAGGTDTFTVVLASEPTADVVVSLASSDTTEGTVAPPSLTFTSGDWDRAQTVTVTGVADGVADGDIAYSIVTGPAESDDPDYDGLDPPDVGVTNIHVDAEGPIPTLALADDQAAEAAGGPVRLSLTFDEVPVGLGPDDIQVSGTAGATAASLSGGMQEWTVVVDDVPGPGTVTVSLPVGAVTDAGGHPSSAAGPVTVTLVDTTPPTLVVPDPVVVSAEQGRAGADVAYPAPTALDPGYSTPPTIDCTPAAGTFFPIGTRTVSCTATDGADHVTTDEFTVTVTDDEDPTIATVEDVVVTLPLGATMWPAAYDPPAASDNSGDVAVECAPAVGAALPVGDHTITCTATDGSENTATTDFVATVAELELTDDERWVVDAYRTFLGRFPEEAGLSHWVGRLADGADRSFVARKIALSPEATGGPVVTDIYDRLLDRAPVAAERSYWAGRLSTGTAHHWVERTVLASAERHAASGGTDEAFVADLYTRVLGRAGGPGEIAYWVERLRSGDPRLRAVDALLNTPEARHVRVVEVAGGALGRPPTEQELEDLEPVFAATRDPREVAIAAFLLR